MPSILSHEEGMSPFYREQVQRQDSGKLNRDPSRNTHGTFKGSLDGPKRKCQRSKRLTVRTEGQGSGGRQQL